jgi:hypothetical protein
MTVPRLPTSWRFSLDDGHRRAASAKANGGLSLFATCFAPGLPHGTVAELHFEEKTPHGTVHLWLISVREAGLKAAIDAVEASAVKAGFVLPRLEGG